MTADERMDVSGQPGDARKTRERGPLQALVAGAIVLALGPLLGLLMTVKRLVDAFSDVEGTAVLPEDKAKVLARGISSAMNATYIGVAVSSVGLVILVAAGIQLVRVRRSST